MIGEHTRSVGRIDGAWRTKFARAAMAQVCQSICTRRVTPIRRAEGIEKLGGLHVYRSGVNSGEVVILRRASCSGAIAHTNWRFE